MPDAPGPPEAAFSRYLLLGILFRAALITVAMACAFGGSALAGLLDGEWWEFIGACVGLGAGVLLAREVKRRWDPLDRVPEPPTA